MLLSIMTYLPLVGALVLMVLPRNDNLFRWFALAITLVNFVLSLVVTLGFDRNARGYQYEEYFKDWISAIGSNYHMGVDGVSVLMIQLNGLLFVLAVIASWKSIQTRVREYYFSLLLLNVGLMGIFAALDFFLFYIFWELVLIPMALLIGIWGGPRRVYAAVKFFLYTLVGSLLMLVGIIAVYFQYQEVTGKGPTLDIPTITRDAHLFSETFQIWAFLAFAIAFAIKVPLWPFHTWLPDAHTEAPTAGSVILAGNMLKMGCYGFIRFNLALFPDASKDLAPLMIGLGIIAIIYGALVAIVQPDMKRLVAYTSVSHMGFVILGLFSFAYGLRGKDGLPSDRLLQENSQGFDGAVFTMFSHGLLTGGLFLCVGVVYERLHTRDIGIIQNTTRVASRMPAYASVYMLYTLGSLGLPMISGFVGEFLAMQGAFRVNGWIAFATSFVIILAAIYMLWLYQRAIWGKPGDYGLAVANAAAHDVHAHGVEHTISPAAEKALPVTAHEAAQATGTTGHPQPGHAVGHMDESDSDIRENGAKFPDLNLGEWLTLYPMAALSVLLGVFPSLVIDFLHKPAEQLTLGMMNHGDQVLNVVQQLGK